MNTIIAHAFNLPEICFVIARYLDATDVLACSVVSKAFFRHFSPLVWRDIHFGKPADFNREETPFARAISIPPNPENHPSGGEDVGAGAQEAQPLHLLVEFMQRNGAWVRSLSVHDQNSVLPLIIGKTCTRLESISLYGLSEGPEGGHDSVYWNACRELLRLNRGQLRSLSLTSWTFDKSTRAVPGQPRWNPILKCTHALNLRSLSLKSCVIRGRHLKALWEVAERLEALVLDECDLDLTLRPVAPRKKKINSSSTTMFSTVTKTSDLTGLVPQDRRPRFPNLRELTIHEFYSSYPQRDLELLILQSPRLQTLHWTMPRITTAVIQEFCNSMEASTWPELSSITLKGDVDTINTSTYHRILVAIKCPLRQFVGPVYRMELHTYPVLKAHFSSLEAIDLFPYVFDNSEWIIEVLTSCRNLKSIKAARLKAQDIFKSAPWVCRGLQVFHVFIDMGFLDHAPYRKLTDDELAQCRRVFKQIATLPDLRELDMLAPYRSHLGMYGSSVRYGSPDHPRHLLTSPPMRLEAGLDLLAPCKKLETVRFWGGKHVIRKTALVWMVDHWKHLKVLCGMWAVAPSAAGTPLSKRYLVSGKFVEWLSERGVSTKGSFCNNESSELLNTDCGDCCAPLDGEVEVEVEVEVAKAQIAV
ncbi:hypothetical protein BGZ99_002869 [Dissophora globulifera]|uniref:F-box domain-containing protein n=1 Tax=Dissophora globulifera TaxID=979702 RepID=A0A9P6UX50_9FUNG|nr:hypothetical protein BGZ99_002869 [Dissophora globulifera]